jgi:predicted ArsR family transcriptional regulator
MADATVTAAGLRIVKMLVGNAPLSVTELIKAIGVTRTAITEQLNELVTAGFVERGVARLSGRGRPKNVYGATNAALALLHCASHRIVVPAIWQAISDVGGEELKNKIAKKVGRAIADYYNNKITAKKPADRMRQLVNILNDEGCILDSEDRNGQLIIYKRSCPFISVADSNRTICRIDVDMMTQVAGRQVRRTGFRHNGDPCCIIEIDK